MNRLTRFIDDRPLTAFFSGIALGLSLIVWAATGCTSLSTNTFRTEQTAVNLAFTAYVGWTNYLVSAPVTPTLLTQSNDVRKARLEFAASVTTLEALRGAYETNSALEAPLQAAVSTVVDKSSNIVWLINYFKNP